MKTRTRLLITSILSIVCCVSMIVGATLALFTSESKVNIAVTAGKVEVLASVDVENAKVYSAKEDESGDLVDENGYKYSYEEQENLTFKNGGTVAFSGNEVTISKVTPGDKVTFPIKVINNDNVTAKYRTYAKCVSGPALFQGLNVTILDEDFNVSEGKITSYNVYSEWEVLDIPSSESEVAKTVNVTIEFPITAGNQYQNLSTKILYGVEAIQGNAHTEDYEGIETSFYENLNENITTEVEEGKDTVIEDEYKALRATISKEATEITGATSYQLKAIREPDESQSNFRLIGAEHMTYDIKLLDDEGNVVDLTDTDQKVKIEIYAGKDLEFVALFHNEEQIAGQEDYDPVTGYVTCYTDGFSPYDLAYSYAPVVIENLNGTFKYYQKLQDAVNEAEENQQIIVNYTPMDTDVVKVKDKNVEIVTANSIIERENALIENEEEKFVKVVSREKIFEDIKIETEGTASVQIEAGKDEIEEEKFEDLIDSVASVGNRKFDNFPAAMEYAIANTKADDTVVIKLDKEAYLNDNSIEFGKTGYSEAVGKNRAVLTFDNKIKIDLNEKTLYGRINLTKGDLTLDNGTIRSSSQALNIFGSKDVADKGKDYSKITLGKDAVVYAEYGFGVFAGDPNQMMYPVGFGEEINIYGKIHSPSPVYVSGNVGMDTYEANLGKRADIEAYGEKPSSLMAKYGPKINIYDGALLDATEGPVTENPQGITLSGYVKVYVYGGEIIGGEGVGIKGGELHVYNGKITSIGDKKDPIQAVNSGNESSGAAISVSSFYNANYPAIVDIQGGEIVGTNNVAVLVACSVNDNTATKFTQGVTLSVGKGATLKCLDDSIGTVAYIANSNAITYNATGEYVLVPVMNEDEVLAYKFGKATLNDSVYSVQLEKDITDVVSIVYIGEGNQPTNVNYDVDTGVLTFKANDNSNCKVTVNHNFKYIYTETTHQKYCDNCKKEYAVENHDFVDGVCSCGYKTDAKLLEENANYTCRIGAIGYERPFSENVDGKKDSALKAAKSGDTIKMIANYTTTNAFLAQPKTNDFEVTIDLNGKSITVPSKVQLTVGTYNFIDSSAEKTGYVNKLDLYNNQDRLNTITVNLRGGTFDHVTTDGDHGDKTVNIYDGAVVTLVDVQGSEKAGHEGQADLRAAIDAINIFGGEVTYYGAHCSLDASTKFHSEVYSIGSEVDNLVKSPFYGSNAQYYKMYNLVDVAE